MNPDASSRGRFRRYRAGRWRHDADASGSTRRGHFARRYWQWLRPWRASLAVVFALSLCGLAFELVLPLATRQIIDHVLLGPDVAGAERGRLLNAIALAVAAALVLAQGVEAVRTYKAAALNARLVFGLRRRLFDHLMALPLQEVSALKTGGIVSRLSGDIDSVTGLVSQALLTPGAAFAKTLVVFAILLNLRWPLALAAAALLPPLAWVSFLYVTRARPIYRSVADDRSAVDGRVGETFGGLRVVRAFRREARERLDYAVGHHLMIRKNLFAELVNMVIDAGWSLLIPLTSLIIVWFGGYLYLRGAATVGDIVAFQMYSSMLLFPVWLIVLSMSQTQKGLAAMERVFEILEKAPGMPERPGAKAAPREVAELAFDRVSFAYQPGTPVIHDFTLKIPAGITLALVGASGAGKTTLADLAARFHDPSAGAVRLNGIDLRDLRARSYRQLLGVVQQDVFLFDGTVGANIAYGRPDASRAQVVAAAESAHADAFIRAFPGGYDTIIGERGVKLSGGQRQRLSIARALLADPKILILDEATSSLDSDSEHAIQAALRALFKGRTTIVIAHRLSTIAHADRIAVIAAGRLVETGTHAELLGAGGVYAAMVERQRSSFLL